MDACIDASKHSGDGMIAQTLTEQCSRREHDGRVQHVRPKAKSRRLVVPSHSADNGDMLWWFERDVLHTRVEVLHLASGGYELRIFDAKGAEHVELFTDASDLARRQQAVQDALIAQGWERSGEWLL